MVLYPCRKTYELRTPDGQFHEKTNPEWCYVSEADTVRDGRSLVDFQSRPTAEQKRQEDQTT